MTQVFANISSLAEFLVAQKNLPKSTPDASSPVTGFEDFLSGQIAIGDLPADSQKSSDFGIESNPVDLAEISNPASPIWEFSGFVKFPIQQLTGFDEQAIDARMVDSGQIPSESIAPVQMNVGQLKLMASQQQIPLSLTLNPAELASIINDNQLKGAADLSPNIPDTGLSAYPNIQTAQIPAELSQLTRLQNDPDRDIPVFELPSTKIDPQPAQPGKSIQLSFDAAQLLDSRIPALEARINQDDSGQREIQVKVSDLLNLIEKMPEKPLVQIKSTITQQNQNQNPARSDTLPGNSDFEKSYLVNLSEVASGKDSESLEVLQKISLVKANSAVNSIQLSPLNQTTETTGTSINLESNTPVLSVPITEFTESEQVPSRKIDNQRTVKIETREQPPIFAKLKNQEIRPVQADKAVENSVVNIFGKGNEFGQRGSQSIGTDKQAFGQDLSTTLVGQQKILNQIQSQLQSFNGDTHLTIQLKPESLGKVKVELKTEGDKLNATFRVDNPDVKRVLDAELPNLKQDWKIDSIRVETNARTAQDGLGNSNNHDQAKMSEGRSSGAAYRTNQPEVNPESRNRDAARTRFLSANGRVDFFA